MTIVTLCLMLELTHSIPWWYNFSALEDNTLRDVMTCSWIRLWNQDHMVVANNLWLVQVYVSWEKWYPYVVWNLGDNSSWHRIAQLFSFWQMEINILGHNIAYSHPVPIGFSFSANEQLIQCKWAAHLVPFWLMWLKSWNITCCVVCAFTFVPVRFMNFCWAIPRYSKNYKHFSQNNNWIDA